MKKNISFKKDLEFTTMIGEITEINLEEKLKFVDSNNIEGSLIVSGKYKITKPSILEEEFSFDLPVQITLVENLEEKDRSVKIADFKYQIVDDSILNVEIELLIEGMEIVELDEEIDRECDDDKDKEVEIPRKEDKVSEEKKVEKEEFTEDKTLIVDDLDDDIFDSNNNSLFSNLADEDDSFETYSVYIMREGDTIEKVLEKYSVTKEKLEEYNDLEKININSKVIIPNINND